MKIQDYNPTQQWSVYDFIPAYPSMCSLCPTIISLLILSV